MTIMRGRSARETSGAVLLGAFLAAIWLTGPAAAAVLRVEMIDGVRHVHNDAVPVQGERTLRLAEAWRINVMEAEELIGVVSDVIAGPDGTIWMVDSQLGRVLVYSAEGTLLRTLCRPGEGPGELESPHELAWPPGGGLGIVDRRMGELTRVDPQGAPLPSLRLQDAAGQPFASLRLKNVDAWAGTLAVCGTIYRFDEADTRFIRIFSLFDAEGREIRRLMEAPSGFDFQAGTFDEAANYFVDRGQWTIDTLGRIVYAPDRDRYRLEVCDATGALVQVVERDYEPQHRSAEDKDAIREGLSMTINGEPVQLQCKLEDHDRCVASMTATEDGRVWVLSTQGRRARREGTVGSYDLFDAEGTFLETIRFDYPMDQEEDVLHQLSDGRWVLLRNLFAAQRVANGQQADDEDASDEDRPLEIICLKPAED